MSLTRQSLSAVLWSGADIMMRQGLQFFVSLLLARLLAPEDFGVIAMLYVFIAVAGVFVDSGFGSALIQRQDISYADQCTVFFFNLAMGALTALALCAAAPWIAGFFAVPALKNLTYVMALNLFIGALGSIQGTLLARELNFKMLMKAGALSSLLSGLLAIALAWRGYGVWSLAWQTLSSTALIVILLWCWHPWRPGWLFSLASLRRLFRFGGFMMISSLIDVFYGQMYTLLIGKLFSSRELGFYGRAERTQQLPAGLLSAVLGRVAFPLFSAAAADPEKLARGLRQAIVLMMAINIPLMLGLAVVAEPLVTALFGVKWLPSVPLLQVLCLAGLWWPLHVINLNVLMAQGHSDLFLRLEIIKKGLAIPLLILASLHSLNAIVWCQVATGALAFFINAYYSGILLGHGAWRQLREIMPAAAVAVAMAAAVALTGHGLHWLTLPAWLAALIAAPEWLSPLLGWPPLAQGIARLQQWPPAAGLTALSLWGCLLYLGIGTLLQLEAFKSLYRRTGRPFSGRLFAAKLMV